MNLARRRTQSSIGAAFEATRAVVAAVTIVGSAGCDAKPPREVSDAPREVADASLAERQRAVMDEIDTLREQLRDTDAAAPVGDFPPHPVADPPKVDERVPGSPIVAPQREGSPPKRKPPR